MIFSHHQRAIYGPSYSGFRRVSMIHFEGRNHPGPSPMTIAFLVFATALALLVPAVVTRPTDEIH